MHPTQIGRPWRRLALVLALLVPAVAIAHAHLKSSVPAAGSRLTTAPTMLRLTFTEPPALAFTRVDLHDSAGRAVTIAALVIPANDRNAVVTPILGVLASGPYTVAWQMAGDDGHVTRGTVAFTLALPPVAAPDSPAAGAVPPADVPSRASPVGGVSPAPDVVTFDAQSPLYTTVRWLQFIGLLSVIGAVVFSRVVRGVGAIAAPGRARAARAALWTTALVAVAAALRLVAQAYTLRDAAHPVDAATVSGMLVGTVWGMGWLLQALAVVVCAVGFGLAARGRTVGWPIAALGAFDLAFTPALSGHAAAAPHLAGLSVLADGLHVLGAGGWLGGLLFLLAVGVPTAMRLPAGERGRAVADLVNAFSPVALACAGLTVATGVYAAWSHLNAVSDLWLTGYGQLLFRKLVTFTVVLALGAYNWRRMRPSLGDDSAAGRPRRSSTIELAFAVVILAITAMLVATPTPADDTPTTTALVDRP